MYALLSILMTEEVTSHTLHPLMFLKRWIVRIIFSSALLNSDETIR